jgi:hypothetical protein
MTPNLPSTRRAHLFLLTAVFGFTFAILLLGSLELAIRALWPQHISTEYVGGHSLGVPDPQLGHVLRPSAHAIVRGPEFSVEYRINQRGLRDHLTH